MVKRILDATASDFKAMNGTQLAESIRLGEGRALAAEVICTSAPPIDGITHGELAAAMGADLIVLDGYDPLSPRINGAGDHLLGEMPLANYADLLGRPVGINLICAAQEQAGSLGGRLVSEASVDAAVAQGLDCLFLYSRPPQGGTPDMQADAARMIEQCHGDRLMVIGVPSFLKPPPRDVGTVESHRDEISRLLDAGCEGVAMPMPGSKQGWMADRTAALIDHAHGKGGLVWLFVTGSVEGAPASVMHDLALLGKQLGADAFRLDEAGLSGMASPENILAFSLALRGERHTYRRMASSIRR